jgi:hypothetical protein
MSARCLTAVALMACLSACDAWPTVINNQSGQPIRFRYAAQGETGWSATFALPSGEAQSLAREHWVQDIRGFRVLEGARQYDFTYQSLGPVRAGCSSTELGRRLKLTADCYVTYLGQGRIRASYQEPNGLHFSTR